MFPSAVINHYGNKRIANIKKIKTTSGVSTLILYDDGNLYGFGSNPYYQLGLGHKSAVQAVTLIATNVDDFWSSQYDTLLRKGNKFYAAGVGHIFDTTSTVRTTFTDVTSYFNAIDISTIKKIDIGAISLCVLTTSNTLYACGLNNNCIYNSNSSVRYGSLTLIRSNVADIKSNNTSGLFILSSNDLKIYASGSNGVYQLGTTTTPQLPFTLIYPGYTFTYNTLDVIGTSWGATFINNAGISTDSTNLRFSGSNLNGQLSIGSASSMNYSGFSSASVLPSGFTTAGIKQIYDSCANYTSPAFRTSTGVYICGLGTSGNLGTGAADSVSTFTRMSALDSVVKDYSKLSLMAVGFYATYVVYENKLYACGGGSTTTANVIPGYSTMQTSFVPIQIT